jgi:hypothetical protein
MNFPVKKNSYVRQFRALLHKSKDLKLNQLYLKTHQILKLLYPV